MPRRRVLPALALALLLSACGGGGDSPGEGAQSTATTAVTARPSTTSTRPPIEGVETFLVEPGHSDTPVSYPQVPPVGGTHNPVWQQCGYYDQPVPNEKAVHSLEHGAIWITYRPDLPAAQIQGLATLARDRNLVLVSRWDNGLPAPVVVTAWGRQLRLESATDPRLMEFVRLYVNQGPEINAPC
ncbi:MAG TPA: DUF3105 domain-containing protein [Acidimicrobiales bacterium]|nr:DUF3105 domain-containing protein [Acidimicrobiales bacterium]